MIGVGIVTDRPTTGAALVQVLTEDPDLTLIGRSSMPTAPSLLRDPALRVLSQVRLAVSQR
jgi:hypothetical protein